MIRILTMLALAVSAGLPGVKKDAPVRIVFVCEHGAAKSVIASVLFNKLAAERGLPFRSTYRGATPQDDLSVKTVEGLKADGLPVPDRRPSPVTASDIDHAKLIYAIGCTVPESARRSGKVHDWNDVPDMSEGYAAVRDAVLRHVERLIFELRKQP